MQISAVLLYYPGFLLLVIYLLWKFMNRSKYILLFPGLPSLLVRLKTCINSPSSAIEDEDIFCQDVSGFSCT